MENNDLLKRINALGFPLFWVDGGKNANLTLADMVKSRDLRFWEGFPVVLVNSVEKGLFDYNKVRQYLKKPFDKAHLDALVILSLALYRFFNLKFSRGNEFCKSLLNHKQKEFNRFLGYLKNKNKSVWFFVLVILIACFYGFAFADSHKDSWKNFYGIAWKGTAEESIKYARQMGYDYVMILSKPADYKNIAQRAGLKFYIPDPENWEGLFEGNNRVIDTRKTYAQPEIDFFNRNMVWRSNKPFPNNLATGWFPGAESGIRTAISERFVVSWDFQQQRVIDEVIEKIIAGIKTYDEPETPFTFAGIMYDTADLRGTFWRMKNDGHVEPVLISYWTNSESGLLHDGITHEYATYADGKAAFFKKLNLRLKQEFPGREIKWIIEPTIIYSEKSLSDWVYTVKGRPDKEELTPDMFFQEGSGTDFVDNEKIFHSGMRITKAMVGITQPNDVGEYENRLYAAKAGINGAWYNWFGRFGGSGDMPVFQTIADVYPRLKLIRCIPNWDNLNDIPLKERSWNGEVYRSPKSYISADLIYSRQPKTGKLFVVFNTHRGAVRLSPGEKIVSVQRVDGLFIETGDGAPDVDISALGVRLKESVSIEVDTRNNQVKGRGYILEVK